MLLIDPDPRAKATVLGAIAHYDFAVDHATSGQDGLAAISACSYGLIVAELALPDMSGVALLERARNRGCSIPILMVSAEGDISRRIEALDAGADDYLVKPYDPGELGARIRALARRSRDMIPLNISCGNVVLNCERREISVGGARLELGQREFSLLECLIRNNGQVLPRNTLLESLYGFDQDIESNSIEVHVHRIRKRLAAAGSTVRIENRRAIGYVLVSIAH